MSLCTAVVCLRTTKFCTFLFCRITSTARTGMYKFINSFFSSENVTGKIRISFYSFVSCYFSRLDSIFLLYLDSESIHNGFQCQIKVFKIITRVDFFLSLLSCTTQLQLPFNNYSVTHYHNTSHNLFYLLTAL